MNSRKTSSDKLALLNLGLKNKKEEEEINRIQVIKSFYTY